MGEVRVLQEKMTARTSAGEQADARGKKVMASGGKGRRKNASSLGEEGFTLLEMLLVICIIGVLAAVAVPKFSQSMTLANTSKIQADLSTLNTAVGLYRAERGTDPTSLEQLKEYIVNINALKPPSGSYFLRNGQTVEKAGTDYALIKGTDGETQATLDEHRLQDVGRMEKSAESSG